MDTRSKGASRSYEEFQPLFEWKEEGGFETLVIFLPGFNKDQLTVQANNVGNLTVSGERPLAGNCWSRFRIEFQIPQSIRDYVSAKFENGNLYVNMPKITKPQPQAQPPKAQEPAQEPESGKGTTMETGLREKQDVSRKDGAPLTSKSGGPALKQSNKKSGETGKPTDSTNQSPDIKEKGEDQIHKPEDQNKPTSETGDKDGELSSSRKRQAEVKEETSRTTTKAKGGGPVMRFKRPRQLIVNAGVAAVILVGLVAYMSYKFRNYMRGDET